VRTEELASLKRELDAPGLSHRRSTLGIAVASAALASFGDAPSGSAPKRIRPPRRRGAAPGSSASFAATREPTLEEEYGQDERHVRACLPRGGPWLQPG
jgi:hypothetical protein